jgi:uncharacterized protein (TIGR03089 family)
MPTPPEVLSAMLRSDPGRPRVTYYDDTSGPTQGERVELSARVLDNWVSKAANALQEEWDLGPGSRVHLDLPPHWRAFYWAMATWSVGATLALDGSAADLVVTADEDVAASAGRPAVLVTLAALARSASAASGLSGLSGAGVMDEARELATFADQFSAWDEPAPSDVALSTERGDTAYDALVPARDWPARVRLHTAAPDLHEVLLDSLGAWALDGSVVISRGAAPTTGRDARLASEGVTMEV